ncbi:hypothetical protein GGF46_004929 [Coemansia sp. RSA 552]|nr:hypothetical protein GGF46_004929 [Coemansia sp. RSA 552]
MKLAVGVLGTAVVVAHSAASVAALPSPSEPKLVVFGDSWSDTGALWEMTNKNVPPPPYWQGRFSTGPVYTEYLATLQNLTLDSHAIGGSTMDGDYSALLDTIATASAAHVQERSLSINQSPSLLSTLSPDNLPSELSGSDNGTSLRDIVGLVEDALYIKLPLINISIAQVLDFISIFLPFKLTTLITDLIDFIVDVVNFILPGIMDVDILPGILKRSLADLPLKVPGITKQINQFALAHPLPKKLQDDVVVLQIGTSDLLVKLLNIEAGRLTANAFANPLTDTVIHQLKRLSNTGFTKIVVVDMPSIQFAPFARALGMASVVDSVVDMYNQMLRAKIDEWISETDDLEFFATASLSTVMETTVSSEKIAAELGITDTTSSCVSGNLVGVVGTDTQVCSNPAANYFVDYVHPTEKIQRLFGYYTNELVNAVKQGLKLDITEDVLLNLIGRYNLGNEITKPAQEE